jgi:hypothetical protein
MRSNIPPETALADALDTILADLRSTLAAIHKPAELIAAETRVIEARERRAQAWEAYRALVSNLSRSVARDAASEAEVHRSKAELDKAEGEVVRAQRALGRHRERYGKTVAAAIERHRVAAAAAVAGAADILAIAAAAAATEHIELLDVVEYNSAIEGLVTAAHRAAWRQRQRRDGEFSKSAAAMAARAAPPAPPSGPIRWTGRMSDLVGGEVVDAPVPISPGSQTTVQRIPAALQPVAPPRHSTPIGIGAVARSILRKR